MPITVPYNILWHIHWNPGQSATQIAKATGRKASSLSSLLHKASVAGIITRAAKGGPRGGYTYTLTNPLPDDRRTAWEHLLEDD